MLRPSSLILITFSFIVCFVSPFLSAGELVYIGTLSQTNRNGTNSPVKEFTVRCFAPQLESGQALYRVEEDRPPLPWIEQMGATNLTTPFGSLDAPAIGYRHEERMYALPLLLPFVPRSDAAASEEAWEHDGSRYEVIEERSINGATCWSIRAKTGPARVHTILVRQSDHVVVSGRQTMFMGQGDKFQIDFELSEEGSIDPEQLTREQPLWERLLSLKRELNHGEAGRTAPLTPMQIKQTAARLPELVEAAERTSLVPLLEFIHKDVETQLARMKQVESLADSMTGKPVPPFTLTQLDETPLPLDLAERVTVLHFWSYMDEPLEQPYGQTGYLDFMASRWQKLNVGVYGVAVDSRLQSPDTRKAAVRSIKKLKQFMRLNYDITYDGGAVLNAFGNPTRLGEEMPLWVVIAPGGKIIHYRTGHYEVDNRSGLKELDDIVRQSATATN